MSFYIHDFVWKKGLSGTQKLVLLAIAHRADYLTGICYPSIGHIAEMCNCTARYVQKIISGLVEDGHLERVIGGGAETPTGATNQYTLCGYTEYYAKVSKLRDGVDPKSRNRDEQEFTPPLNYSSPRTNNSRVEGNAPENERNNPAPKKQEVIEPDAKYLDEQGRYTKPVQSIIDALFTAGNNYSIIKKYLLDDLDEYGVDAVQAVVTEGIKHGTQFYAQMRWRYKHLEARKTEQYTALLKLLNIKPENETQPKLKRIAEAALDFKLANCDVEELAGLHAYISRIANEGKWRQWGEKAMLQRLGEYRELQAKRADAIARQQAQAEQIDAEPDNSEPDIDPAYWPDDVPMPGTPEWDAYIETQAEVSDEYL